MHVIHAALKFEPTFKVLGEAKYGLRKITRDHRASLGEQADFFPGFEPAEGEHVVRERAGGSSVFVGTTLDSYLRNNGIFDIYLADFSLRQRVESSMRNAHDLGYTTNVICGASAGYRQLPAFSRAIRRFPWHQPMSRFPSRYRPAGRMRKSR